MLNFKNDYFKTEVGRNLYPTNFDDFSRVEVFGSKLGGPSGQEASANIYKIPKSYYKYNAGNIDFTDFPNGVASVYQTVKIVFYENLFSLDINFTGEKDITPENLQETFQKVGVALKDMQNRLSKVALYVDSSEPGQINLPKLPNSSIWYRDSDGNISSLPIEKFHNKFSELINEIYSAVEKKLDAKVIQLDKEQEAYFETLKQKLLEIEARIALMQEHSYADVPYMGKDLIMVYIEDDGTYRECNHLQQEPRDAVGIVVTINGVKKTRCYFNGVYDLPASMVNYRAGTYWQSDSTRTELTLTEPLIWKSIAFKVAGGKIYFDVGNPILLTSQEGAILFAEFETITQANNSPEKFPYIRVLGDKVVDDGGQGAYKWNGASYVFIGAGKQLQILEAKGNEETAKVTAEGTTQINKIKATGIDAKADKNKVKEIPIIELFGSIRAENNRLFTSGAFNNITDLDQASVTHHGDSAIITTPSNKFNAIINWNEIYTGPSFENLFYNFEYSPRDTIVWTGDNAEITVVNTSNSLITMGQYSLVEDEPFTISFKAINFEVSDIADSIKTRARDLKLEKIKGRTVISGVGTATLARKGIEFIIDRPLVVGEKLYVEDIMVTRTPTLTPYIERGFTFPQGAISFDGTEGMNFDGYSYIGRNIDKIGRIADFLKINNKYLAMNSLIEKDTSFIYSTLYNRIIPSGNMYIDTSSSSVDKLHIGYQHLTSSFSQFLAYNKSLTQAELETELAKNLAIDGEVDVIAKIENLMRIGAILGKRPKGDIQDNQGTTTVGDIWYDQANEKYYECKVATDETFIDLQKWEERSLDAMNTKIENIKSIGVQQTWQDMTSNRSRNTEYTNDTGMPIMVTANMDTSTNGTVYLALIINGMKIFTNNTQGVSGTQMGVSGIVPNGSTYKIIGSNVNSWFELRG